MQPFNPLELPEGDAPWTRHPVFSFFHSAAWTKVLIETYGFTPTWFGAENAWLPLMEVDSWLTGRRGIALPFTDDCAPLCHDEKSFRELWHQAVAFGQTRGWKSVELRGGREFMREAPASISFYGHALDLMADESLQFETMAGSARQAVRKAEKAGVTVEVSQSLAAVRDFYHLQCLTRQRHGLPPQPWEFFLNLHRHIVAPNQGIVVVASQAGEKIAAAVYLFLGERAIYKYGASDYAHQHLRGSNLVMWTALRWLAQKGVTRLHLGKTALANAGLRRFKLNLGATEEVIEYMKYDLRRNQFIVEPDGVTGWHNQVFRTLPGWSSRLVGGLLYKHWA